ncbi:MAG TPA: hypothetical protein VMR96_03715 [Solirubrobacterales bacterium]|nr:hypothetical protein [Solirubrobacterales bacterium]
MPSASRASYRASLLAACVLLLAVVATGCQTTQDTAAERQAESKLILEKREQKQQSKSHDKGSEKR